MHITLKLDGTLDLEAIRLPDGNWTLTGTIDDEPVDLRPTGEQLGAMLFLCAAGNPSDTKLDSALYALLTEAQKNSGVVP